MSNQPAVWFPTVRAGTGTDVFTERLAASLNERGIRTEITWLPLRAEYAPWTVSVPKPPSWANIAHVNTWLHSRFLPRQLPVIATLHHSIHDPALRPYKGIVRSVYHRWWIAPNERRVMQRARRVVAVSQFAADIAHKTLVDVPMDIIYNGIDTERFRPPPGERKPHQPFRLLYVGNWVALKGVDLLAPIMRELGEGFELRYTGGPAAERDKPDMPANMNDIGRLQDADAVIAAMQDADVFLFPSRSEGLPLSVLEAMACGLPVIATRGSSLVEVVKDGITGSLCEQDNVQVFAKSVRRLAENPEIWQKISAEGSRLAVDRYCLNRMVNAYAARYQSAVRDNRPLK